MKFIIIHLKYHYNSENDNIDNIIENVYTIFKQFVVLGKAIER